jgi:hypothetical protein
MTITPDVHTPEASAQMTREITRRLASAKKKDRMWLARSPHVDPQILADLVTDAVVAEREASTAHLGHRDWSTLGEYQRVARVALANPLCPPATLNAALSWDFWWAAQSAVTNPSLTAQQLRAYLAYASSGWTRGAALGHPNCPMDLVIAQAYNPEASHHVLSGLAAHPDLPGPVQVFLAGHRNSSVAKSLAQRQVIDPHALAILLTSTRSGVLTALIRSGHATQDTIDRAAAHASVYARSAAAAGANDPDVVTRLAMDRDPRVRNHATRNVACPEEGHVVAALIG